MARFDEGHRYDSSVFFDTPDAGPPPTPMSQQDLSSTGPMPEADYDAIMDAFDIILTKLTPYAVPLSPEERQSLMKQGPKSMEFVTGMKTLSDQLAGRLASIVDLPGYAKDTGLCTQAFALNTKVLHVAEIISDLLMAAGSDCMVTSLTVYRLLQALRDGTLDDNLRQLGRRFERAARLPATPPTP